MSLIIIFQKTIISEIVKKAERDHMDRTSISSTTKRMLITSALIKKKIASFLDSNSKSITSKEVWFFVFKETGIRTLIHLVRNYMKEELRLSYKIRNSRQVLYSLDKSMMIKSYFNIKVIKLLPFIDVLVKKN